MMDKSAVEEGAEVKQIMKQMEALDKMMDKIESEQVSFGAKAKETLREMRAVRQGNGSAE